MKKGTRLKIGELSGWSLSTLLIIPTVLLVVAGNVWLIYLAFQHHREVWRDSDRAGVGRSMELVSRQFQDELTSGQESDAGDQEFLETVRRTAGYAYVKVLRPDGKPWGVASRDMVPQSGGTILGPARSGKVLVSERDEGSSRVESHSTTIESPSAGPLGSVEIGNIVQPHLPSKGLVLEWILISFGPLGLGILWLRILCLRMQRELTQLGSDVTVITTTGNFDHVIHDIGWMPKELVAIRSALRELIAFGQRIQQSTGALESQDLNSEDLRKPLAGSIGQALKNICWDFVQMREKLNALANGDLYDLRLDESVRGVIGQNQMQMLEYLRKVHSQLQIMARGDLDDSTLQKRLAGDLGLVLKILLRKVKGVVDVARRSTISLTEVGSRMKVMADQQSAAAMTQASSVSEATATLTQLATSAGQIAESTNHVLKMAEQTLKSARSGRGAVEEVVRGIEEIRRYNEENTRQVHQLLQTSEKIAEVLEVINGIAGQTRLLSLNAAIEAARAGEAGKGFSIVAVEVRKLADSVVESTGQIQGLVEGIRSLTSSIVESAVQGEAKVREGVNLARKAGGSLTEIDALADQTAQFAHQISISTRQQKVGTEQTVEEIKGLTQACSRMEEGARSYAEVSEELEALGGRVRDQLVEFSSQTGRLLSSRDSQGA